MYDRLNWEALWQVLRMYGVGGKLLMNGIKSMYVNTIACVEVKGSDHGVGAQQCQEK